MPHSLQLRVHQGPRDPGRFPVEDVALGRALFGQVTRALERGLLRPALLTLDANQVFQYDVGSVRNAVERRRLMAALGGQPGLECSAMLGVVPVRRARQEVAQPGAVVFIEWPDNRWWSSWLPLGPDRKPLADQAIERSAVEGWPRPGGVGGWFSTVRRTGLRYDLKRTPAPGDQPGLTAVH